jgi:tRNA G18 (ribose-2'-O)-methylase SpoU
MGAVRRVLSAEDVLLADYVGLTDMALRARREPAEGLFIAEGDKVIRRALDAGYAMRSMLLEEKWLPAMADVVEAVDAPVYLATLPVLEAVTGYSVHRGALAAMARRPALDALALAAVSRRLVVLEEVNNHTNIGAVLRCAAGLGVDAVLLDPRCADPLYRRSVKVSMGAVFAVPWARLAPWPGALADVRDLGFTLLALTPEAAATSVAELAPDVTDRAALMLGAEGPGLSAGALAAADLRVRIPMAAGVDSLNVAAAAAVAFYAIGAGAQSRR